MKDGFIEVAAATPEIKVADCAFNASSVISLIAEAEAKGAAVIVFPELCLTGGTAGDLFFTDALLSGAEEALLRIIKATNNRFCRAADYARRVNLRLRRSRFRRIAFGNRAQICAFRQRRYFRKTRFRSRAGAQS